MKLTRRRIRRKSKSTVKRRNVRRRTKNRRKSFRKRTMGRRRRRSRGGATITIDPLENPLEERNVSMMEELLPDVDDKNYDDDVRAKAKKLLGDLSIATLHAREKEKNVERTSEYSKEKDIKNFYKKLGREFFNKPSRVWISRFSGPMRNTYGETKTKAMNLISLFNAAKNKVARWEVWKRYVRWKEKASYMKNFENSLDGFIEAYDIWLQKEIPGFLILPEPQQHVPTEVTWNIRGEKVVRGIGPTENYKPGRTSEPSSMA